MHESDLMREEATPLLPPLSAVIVACSVVVRVVLSVPGLPSPTVVRSTPVSCVTSVPGLPMKGCALLTAAGGFDTLLTLGTKGPQVNALWPFRRV